MRQLQTELAIHHDTHVQLISAVQKMVAEFWRRAYELRSATERLSELAPQAWERVGDALHEALPDNASAYFVNCFGRSVLGSAFELDCDSIEDRTHELIADAYSEVAQRARDEVEAQIYALYYDAGIPIDDDIALKIDDDVRVTYETVTTGFDLTAGNRMHRAAAIMLSTARRADSVIERLTETFPSADNAVDTSRVGFHFRTMTERESFCPRPVRVASYFFNGVVDGGFERSTDLHPGD